jgi:uncharacterized YccA/Bax inhibitor family protein
MNPALDERTFERERAAAATAAGGAGAGTYQPPITDGPVSPWQGYKAMTVGGVAGATLLLFVILLATAVVGWNAVDPPTEVRAASAPGWLFVAVLGGLGLAFATIFKPRWARFTAPLYAAIEGLVLGAISRLFEVQFPGIVLQAVGLTLAVFALMWVAFATRLIMVTHRLRVGIVVATGAVAIVYLVGWVVQLFGGSVSFISEPSAFGILFSLAVVGIAAFNLLLDFDFVQRSVAQGAPKYLEWFAAFGLLVTLVWLYLELLRLLSKLRR